MSSTYKVTISVEVDGPITCEGAPKALTWKHTLSTGDSPHFYGMELQRAIDNAGKAACKNAAVYLPRPEAAKS